MKTFKRTLSLLLAVLMAFSVCTVAFAAEEAAVASDEVTGFTDEDFAVRADNIIHLAGREQEGCPLEEGEGISCRAGSTTFWVTWDGKMTPCGMMTAPVVYPARDGFGAAWDALRAETAALRMPVECTACDHKDVCSACAAVCFTETGRFDGVPTYICEKTREMVRITREHYEEIKRNDHQEGIH